jgi:hypothetical protein
MGAGVGRKRKDHILRSLCSELGVPVKEFNGPHYAQPATEYFGRKAKMIFQNLKERYTPPPINNKRKTFKEYALSYLTIQQYKDFLFYTGYTDYENEDAEDVLYNYGMNDNYENWTAFVVDWNALTDALLWRILSPTNKIVYHQRVVSLTKWSMGKKGGGGGNIFTLTTEKGRTFTTKRVILATTIETLRTLYPRHSIYREIEGQPFLRVYAYFTKGSLPSLMEKVKGYTVVRGDLQKIIPMDTEKGVYMSAYCDNAHARYLRSHLENTAINRAYFERLVEEALYIPKGVLHIQKVIGFYWDIGTHYYKPLSSVYDNRNVFLERARHPEEGVMVVGEVVSMNQGWVEGALETVDKGNIGY